MSTDIFLSYASTDRERVRPLVDALKRRGWSVWWDRDLVPGATFTQHIEQALAAARCVVVVWTSDSVSSQWVGAEAQEGNARHVLVPVLLDRVTPPLPFRHQDAAQLFGWKAEDPHPELERLVRGITDTLAGRRHDPPPRPPPPPKAWRRALAAAAGVVAVTAAVWLARAPPPAPVVLPPNSIAVLALATAGGEGEANQAETVARELSGLLTRLPELAVASPTSSLAAHGDLRDIGQRLDVRYVVEGSLQQSDHAVIADVRLVDTSNARVLWSRRITRPADALLELPVEIARRVVGALDVTLSEESLRQLQSKPGGKPAAVARYLQGVEMLRAPADVQALAAAEREFRAAVAIDGSFTMPYAGLCRVQVMRYQRTMDAADFATAEESCRHTVALDSLQLEPHKALGGLYLASGRLDEAAAEFERARRLSRRDADAVIGLADVAARRKDVAGAEKLFREAVALEPLYWRTHAALGGFLFGRARYAEAADGFRRAVELNPRDAREHESLGGAHYMNGDFTQALASWQKALALTPGATGYANVGTAYFFLRRFGDAAAMYRKAIELTPRDHRWRGQLGDALRLNGQATEASTAYAKAAELARENLTIDAADAGVLALLASYDARLGRGDLARSGIEAALRLTPMDPYAYYDVAVAYATLGLTAQALEALGNAVERGYPRRLVAADPQFDSLHAVEGFQRVSR